MEKRTTQRIMGALVVISLFIIILPFFLNTSESPLDIVNSKPTSTFTQPKDTHVTVQPTIQQSSSNTIPIPPKQAETVAISTFQPNAPEATTPATNNANTVQSVTAVQVSSPSSTTTTTSSPVPQPSLLTQNNSPDTAIPMRDTAMVVNNSVDISPHMMNEVSNSNPSITEPPIKSTAVTPIHPQKHVMQVVKNKQSKVTKTKVISLPKMVKMKVHQNVIAAPKLAWAVQMGSFKNKDNARRLTDHLRSVGFKAFTYKVITGDKERVRVLVGPEYQHQSVAKLSNQLKQKISMQGIVVSYKPTISA